MEESSREAGDGDAAAPRRPEPAWLVRVALLFYAALWLAAWIWRRGLQGEPLWLASPDAEVRALRDAALGLAAAAGVIWLSALMTRRTRFGAALARRLAEAVGPLTPAQCWLLALASGVGEEAFFRGALQPVVGLPAASVLFAAAHFVPRRELVAWSAFSLAAGLLLGALYESTGNLLAPTIAHVVVNGVNLGRLVRDYGRG